MLFFLFWDKDTIIIKKTSVQQSDHIVLRLYACSPQIRPTNISVECHYRKTSLPLARYYRVLFIVPTVLPWSFPRPAEPQPKSNLVHFSLKIWHLVATIFVTFLRSNRPNYRGLNSKSESDQPNHASMYWQLVMWRQLFVTSSTGIVSSRSLTPDRPRLLPSFLFHFLPIYLNPRYI